MLPIQAGRLRHRITINKPVPGTPDSYGGVQNTWQSVGTFWASIESLSGREFEVAKSYAATVSHRIVMRYAPGILPTYQVIYGTRIFNVNGVLNVEERNRQLTLFCTEQIKT